MPNLWTQLAEQLGEQFGEAYLEKQAPGQAPLIEDAISLAVPEIFHAHTQDTPPKAITISFDPSTNTHTVTTEYHPQTLPTAPDAAPAPDASTSLSNSTS